MVSLEFALNPRSPYDTEGTFRILGQLGMVSSPPRCFQVLGKLRQGSSNPEQNMSMPHTHFRKPTGASNPGKTRMSPLKTSERRGNPSRWWDWDEVPPVVGNLK